MTREEFLSRLAALYGPEHGTMARAARFLGVSQRTLHAVNQGWRSVPPSYIARLKQAEVATTERDEEVERGRCFLYASPRLDCLVEALAEAGWSERDALAAILAWAGHRLAHPVGSK